MVSKASSSLLSTATIRANYHPARRRLTSRRHECRQTSTTSVETVPTPSRPLTTPKTKNNYRIQTAILLNRSPILTRLPTPFEAAYHEYYARISRALSNPFPYEFYFKPGSVLESQFKREEGQREMAAFNWGKRRMVTEDDSGVEAKSNNAMGMLTSEEEDPVLPRVTEADKKGDVRSLDRKGHRNLYLLVKKNKGRDEWKLPGGVSHVQDGELLHEAAKRELHAECGVNLDAWIVGRHPIGFMDEQRMPDANFAGCKTFIFKAHILAGQVNPAAGSLADFAWLTKREIKRVVIPEYWTNIQNILSDF